MKTGMLWFDDDPKTSTNDKIGVALTRFKQKYGVEANLVYAHPATLTEPLPDAQFTEQTTKVSLKQARSIQPNHFWLGVEDASG